MSRRVLIKVIIEICVAILFIVLVTITLLKAYGFKYDRLEKAFVKETLVDVVTEFDDIRLYFDGEQVATSTPHKIFNVTFGQHSLRLEKDNFIAWEHDFVAEEDIVSRFGNINLFPENIESFNEVILPEIEARNIFILDEDIFYLEDETFFEFDLEGASSKVIHKFEAKDEMVLSDLEGLIAYNDEVLFYLKDNEIFTYDLNANELKKLYEGSVKKAEEFEGVVYLLSVDKLFSYNTQSLELREIFASVKDFKVLADSYFFIEHFDESFVYHREGLNFKKLTGEDVKLFALDNSADKLISSDGFTLSVIDLFDEKEKLLTRFSKPIQSIKWYKNSYILYRLEGEAWSVCDETWQHCYALDFGENPDALSYLSGKDLFVKTLEKGLQITDF